MEWKDITKKFGTPFYLYDEQQIVKNIAIIREALKGVSHKIMYSLKANSNIYLLSILRSQGVGADVVSIGELRTAMLAGFQLQDITFAGVGKRADEIHEAILKGVGLLVIESLEEYEVVKETVNRAKIPVNFAVRFNPGVDPHTIDKLATGKRGTKFGVAEEALIKIYEDARGNKFLVARGLHVHIGSQIKKPEPYLHTLEILKPIWKRVNQISPINILDIGGGFAYDYEDGKNYAPDILKAIVPFLKEFQATVYIEPGRSIIASSGSLVTSVLYRKEVHGKIYIVVDAGMNDFLRAAFYNAGHRVVNVSRSNGKKVKADIVGPLCEPGDVLRRDAEIEEPQKGDILILKDTGAYGYSMSSNYNTRPRIKELIRLKSGEIKLIRENETIFDILRHEVIPSFQGKGSPGFIIKNVVNLRKFPDPFAERVNQALFGEKIFILKEFDDWFLVRKDYDNYTGWVRKQYVCEGDLDGEEYYVSVPFTEVFDENGQRKSLLPFMSRVVGEEEDKKVWFNYHDNKVYVNIDKLVKPEHLTYTSKDQIVDEFKKFIGIPYLWGGLSPFGFDCSGLVQTVFRRFGIYLPRDTSQQISSGEPVKLENISQLDLLFFPGHVGVCLGNGLFIHSSTKNNGVYIESLSGEWLKNLKSIRRVIP